MSPRVLVRNTNDPDNAAPSGALFVNGVFGSDSATKAQVLAGGGSITWQTIGRAAWGSTNPAVPDPDEAAAAGEMVFVAAGTYSSSLMIGDPHEVLYNPVNEGTPGNYISFVAVGQVRIAAPSANSPAVGAFGRDYIKWYADVELGSNWLITCDGRSTSAGGGGPDTDTDTKGDPDVVNTRADTGPIVCTSCTAPWIEGFVLDGGPQLNYTDNYPAVRFEDVGEGVIRNNSMTSFRNLTSTANSNCVQLYYSADCIVEHNDLSNCGGGVILKDVGGASRVSQRNLVRLNWIEGVDHAISTSLSNEEGSRFYQNVIKGCNIGIHVTGVNLINDWFFNNTFVNIIQLTYITNSSASSGVRIWNSIFTSTDVLVLFNGLTQPVDTQIDWEHNAYQVVSGNFYSGSDGTRDFANYNTAYNDQNTDAPASVLADPLFVDAGASNYRLQAGSPARNLAGALSGYSGLPHAGAYQTGDEVIGRVM